jgi:hypothetical protein
MPDQRILHADAILSAVEPGVDLAGEHGCAHVERQRAPGEHRLDLTTTS